MTLDTDDISDLGLEKNLIDCWQMRISAVILSCRCEGTVACVKLNLLNVVGLHNRLHGSA